MKAFSLGQCEMGYNPATQRMVVVGTRNMNDFGKALGYQLGDEIVKINGTKIEPAEFRQFRQKWAKNVKEGDPVKITVYRLTTQNKRVKKTLKAKAFAAEMKLPQLYDF